MTERDAHDTLDMYVRKYSDVEITQLIKEGEEAMAKKQEKKQSLVSKTLKSIKPKNLGKVVVNNTVPTTRKEVQKVAIGTIAGVAIGSLFDLI